MSDIGSDIIEAGAFLGAALNGYGTTGTPINPPMGTHSSFSILSPTPSSELMVRLHTLRSLLRSAPTDSPLVAAPSILTGVLMKLLGISSNLASTGGIDPTRRSAVPPMLSTPLRKLWVDCVILCHVLGDGLSGNTRINLHGFVKNMIQLAAMNPRAAKAAGGTRIAALEVIAGIMQEEKLAKQLSNWTFDVVQVCQRALKSSGNGEPSYRIAGIRAACAATTASRLSFLSSRPDSNPLLLKGAIEDKVLLEMVRLLKIAAQDRYPEIRSGGADLASIVAPLALHISIKTPNKPDGIAASPTSSLEDIMSIALKNLDDESPMVSRNWAEALARCMCTSIEYNNMLASEKTSNRNVEGDDASPAKKMSSQISQGVGRNSRRVVISAAECSSLAQSMDLLVNMFIKAGGELATPRSSGGVFCAGGRSLRNGFSRTMIELFRLQSSFGEIGEGKAMSHKEAISAVLSLVGRDYDVESTSPNGPLPGNNLFGNSPKVSPADSILARSAAARVLRDGVSLLSPESIQITILHELIRTCCSAQSEMTGNQLQVALMEISHLISTLGEAAASAAEDLMPALKSCVRHADQGVRHEAAIACAAVTSVFPDLGRALFLHGLVDINMEHSELIASVNNVQRTDIKEEANLGARFARFRRQTTPSKELVKADGSTKHKQSIHGLALVISIALKDLSGEPGGLPKELVDQAISIAEVLVNTLFNESMASSNPGGVCTCVKAGFVIICGVFASGMAATADHVALIFGLWKKVGDGVGRDGNFTSAHELVCVEAMLQSTVTFLRYCSGLLLTTPDALSTTSLLLEQTLPLLFPNGRLGKTQSIVAAVGHLDSARAAILEAFAWLPPGSYPMVADSVFEFAASNIQSVIERDVSCSILRSLVSNEDVILDSTALSRARTEGQVGGAQDLENDIIYLRSETASHNERESALHLLRSSKRAQPKDSAFLGSQVLGTIVFDDSEEPAPTPLHDVGTWRRPVMPSCSAKVRLADASIQAFAATFTLKSGKEQQDALHILESLLPPPHLPQNRSSLSDQSRRTSSKDDTAAAANIAAVLLFCLKTLPVFESTHNVPIHLGPMWMTKAKGVFRILLRSPSQEIRRAAAEGLGFLSTLGVREDARFLQSAILHDLDEVIKGTHKEEEQGKPLSIDAICAGRTSAVLALACMQRTANRIQKERSHRSRDRGNADRNENKDTEEILPLFQVLIKILPSITVRQSGGFLGVRAVGMHAFGLLFSYSRKLETETLNTQENHLLKKMVELIEDNFLSSWTAAAHDFDHGTDEDKLASESTFVAVLLRLMTFMTPVLSRLEGLDEGFAARFSKMATLAIECMGHHPTIRTEAMAFFEVLSKHQDLLPAVVGGVKYEEHSLLCCIPTIIESVCPRLVDVHHNTQSTLPRCGMSSRATLRAAVKVVETFTLSGVLIADWSNMRIVAGLFAALEQTSGSQVFTRSIFHRGLSAARASEPVYNGADSTVEDFLRIVHLLLLHQRRDQTSNNAILLRYILMSGCVALGPTTPGIREDHDDRYSVSRVVDDALATAISDASILTQYANPARWQVKVQAVRVMTTALKEMAAATKSRGLTFKGSATFNPKLATVECANACQKAMSEGKEVPHSCLALHIGTLVKAACGMATATVDQVELRCLQENATVLIDQLLECFGDVPDPHQAGTSVLNDDIPQISSSIKNALSSPEEDLRESSCRLFYAGCRTLQTFLRMKITSDRPVLKRIFRPVVLESSDVSYFSVDEKLPEDVIQKTESGNDEGHVYTLLLHVGKLWSIGSIDDSDLLALVTAEEEAMGAHSAALAIEGALLLRNQGLTLGGLAVQHKNRAERSGKICAPVYLEIRDSMNESVTMALVSIWASLASSATKFLARTADTSRNAGQSEPWLRKIVPLLFIGFDDALQALHARIDSDVTPQMQKWTGAIDPSVVMRDCLKGMTELCLSPHLLEIDDSWRSRMEERFCDACSLVLEPALLKNSRGTNLDEIDLYKTCCSFILHAMKIFGDALEVNSPMISSILRPLSYLETKHIDLSMEPQSMIVATFANCLAEILEKRTMPESLVKAMCAIALKASSSGSSSVEQNVRAAAQTLLRASLMNPASTVEDQSKVAELAARSRKWELWSVAVHVSGGSAAEASFSFVQDSILDCLHEKDQHEVLSTVRSLLQSLRTPSPFVGRIICSLLAQVLAVFQDFGVLRVPENLQELRTAVCADCMKIVLVAVQQLSSDDLSQEDVVEFFRVVFETLIAVIRFNGIPNHPPPSPGRSDPAMGRMCAQAITHIARIAPIPFKTSMSLLAEQDRGVMEFAVRAEMSGYATAPAPAAPKKKLNLKSFKT